MDGFSKKKGDMGKKLDRLLGRGFGASKFKSLLKLVVSRVAVLQRRHQVLVLQSRSDVVHLIRLGHHDRALGRVEQVIREQNMLDVYAMIGGYCGLLVERVQLIQQHKFCPEVLKEAMSSLIFAASRCGEIPELHEVRRSLASWYGQEFAAQAVDLRNGCAVSPKIIQKLSASPPSLETRTNLIREIAMQNDLSLPLKDHSNLGAFLEGDQPRTMEFDDVVVAANVAFESAAYAAAAARAAVHLSRSQSRHLDQ